MTQLHTLNRGFGRRYGLLESSTPVPYPPRDGLVGYWNFSEGSGSIAFDKSGYDVTGSFAGTNVPTWVAGKLGTGVAFSTSTSWITLGKPSSLYLPSLTVSAWVNYTSAPNIGSALDMNNQANYGWVVNIHQNGATGAAAEGRIAVYTYSGGWVAAYTSAAVLTAGVWAHVLWTYANGGSVQLYINGSTSGTVSAARPAGIQYSSNLFTFGREVGGNTNQYYGSLDEVLIYNRVLSQTEIDLIYNQKA